MRGLTRDTSADTGGSFMRAGSVNSTVLAFGQGEDGCSHAVMLSSGCGFCGTMKLRKHIPTMQRYSSTTVIERGSEVSTDKDTD